MNYLTTSELHPDEVEAVSLAEYILTHNKQQVQGLTLVPYDDGRFGSQPVTDFLIYMIIPFARSDEEFIDDGVLWEMCCTGCVSLVR